MTFSVRTKEELARIEGRLCCQKAELAALVRFCGSLRAPGPEPEGLAIGTENAGAARKAYKLLKHVCGLEATIAIRRRQRLRKNNHYEVIVESQPRFAEACKALGLKARGIKKSLVGRDCCRRAYLRGAFLGRGSVSSPKGEYHLEIMAGSEPVAQDLAALMARLGLDVRVVSRRRGWTVYIKEGTQIVDCLNLMGAHNALLAFENARVYKEMRNRVNRLVNCDTANLSKAAEASVRHQEIIRRIDESLGLKKLPEPLRQFAELRLRYPDASLRELGELAAPPLSKSCAGHRMRRLEAIAERLAGKEKR
ncbi:DNA-binding protein WhiA [Desulforudis sp. 1088]|uniref:DNA-binding protein WhiA n=1 Tax=unclassified Candidatus Desulforudis TaxID=2635950 RepID=UPI00349A655E